MGHQHDEAEHRLTPRLSGSSTCSLYLPVSATAPIKSFHYTALQACDTKNSLREQWNESVVHGVSRILRTVKHHASCRPRNASPTNAASKVCRHVKDASDFYWQNLLVCQREILCGVSAMLLMMPETVAFSYAANVDPLNGLYATGFLGIVVSLLGGVPATMAGAAGAVAMVMPKITSITGILAYLTYHERLQHLFVAVTLAGVFEIVFGILGLSRLLSMAAFGRSRTKLRKVEHERRKGKLNRFKVGKKAPLLD
ncbi:hypothetical protein PsorP6_002082 [Peronosclerospora sorghi]|uniref:Uncharacterized protein n=1 Tax=Peronosclerospora sorghi TaxID=230839 RepID=A0ACC0WVI7_9STRA|nr:hypothetical protein PsorP6_002082 [Peronosclerospora sorghi]